MNGINLINRIAMRSTQRGLSLIELMIAIALALFLVGGVLTIEQSVRNSYGDQNSLTQLHDNQRLAMTLMNDVIQAAGYFPDPINNTATGEFPASGSFVQPLQVATGTEGGGLPGDSISVRYVASGTEGLMDCTGATVTAAGALTYTFSIINGSLNCSVNGGTQIALVPGITNMSIQYGVKTDASNSTASIDSYLSASEITNSAWWTAIRSVRVTLTFTNPLAAQPNQPATMQFAKIINLNSQTN